MKSESKGTFLGYLLLYLIIVAILYPLVSFVELSFIPAKWSTTSRVILVILSVVVFIFLWVVAGLTSKKESNTEDDENPNKWLEKMEEIRQRNNERIND